MTAPSAPSGKIVDFDQIVTMISYKVEGPDFKSWNNDPMFSANAMYFMYKRPCKVKVEFFPTPNTQLSGLVDVYRWTAITSNRSSFDIAPYRVGGENPTAFEFHANPFYLDLQIGYFEPRVYKGSSTGKIEVTKQFEFRSDKYTGYALFLARRARDMRDWAQQSFYSGDYGLCLHFSRLSIELSLKAIFPAFETSFEWEHDLSKKGRFPLREKIHKEMPDFPLEKILWISQKRIRPDRTDFYGDSESYCPADKLIDEFEAQLAWQDAVFTYERCMALVEKELKIP